MAQTSGTNRTLSYRGRGSVIIDNLNNPAQGARLVGNCSALALSFTEEKSTQKDYENSGGGNADTLSTVSDVTGNVSSFSYSQDVLEAVLRSGSNVVAAGTAIAAEASVITELDSYYESDAMRDTTIPFLVTSGGAPMTEGVDYELKRTGIILLSDGAVTATLAAGDPLEFAYTTAEHFEIQPLTEAQQRYAIIFDGLNEARDNKAVSLKIRCAALDVVSALAMISADTGFAELPFTFEALKDSSITTTGISPYMELKYEV